jgi:hypothetical protein
MNRIINKCINVNSPLFLRNGKPRLNNDKKQNESSKLTRTKSNQQINYYSNFELNQNMNDIITINDNEIDELNNIFDKTFHASTHLNSTIKQTQENETDQKMNHIFFITIFNLFLNRLIVKNIQVLVD